MTNPSNLYAEKIFSEHPTTLWALDDNADYISLIDEADRDLTTWTITNGAATSSVDIYGQPFLDSHITLIEGDVPVSPSFTLCKSPNIINFSNMYQDVKTFCIGTYFYSGSPFLTKVSIGFEYTDTTTSQVIQEFKDFTTDSFNLWSFVSGTFEVPDENTDLRILIKFWYNDGGASSSDYQFYINGVSLGQWSEDFNATSLGVYTETLPASIPLSGLDAIPADPYGLGGDIGYYLVENNGLLARNAGVPMVYGSSNVTRLRPTTNNPSIIFPGKGFLNKVGQYRDYTVEFWLRINCNTSEPKRIFGPIASSDGLYVEEGFLTLVINKQFGSYFVGEWFRPMLLQIKLIRNSASVILNGAEIINIPINTDNLDLPDLYDEFDKNQDWLGFYCYEDVSPMEIDCVAIYPYSVAINVAKRRWVYGQGVVSPELINSAYGGSQAFIDYPFADYTANYNYPDFAKWEQGTFDNLTTTSTSITNPAYALPNIFINNRSLQELYTDNQDIQDPLDYKFISFRPNAGWNSDPCYFNFSRFNILPGQINSIYGVFSTDVLNDEQILFKLYNQITTNYFLIYKDLDEIKYVLNYNGVNEEIYTTAPITSDEKFAVGINISQLVNYFGGNLTAFFGNTNGLSIYVAGEGDDTTQFTKNIYAVGLSTSVNSIEIQNCFEENGTVILDDASVSGYEEPIIALQLLNHVASYTLLPFEAYDSYFLDISIAGSWEDYMPLSYFGQFVKNEAGNTYYDLDFLQFNIGYPSPTKLKEYEETDSWTYEELKEEYQHPIQRTYLDLDNSLITGWNDYEDMQQKAIKYFEYDTENASVRSYVTFQYIEDGANAPQDFFTTTIPANEGKVLDINQYENWETTKFEVVDNTLIYPTSSVDFNKLALVYHLDFKVRGILRKPIALRRLELASQAFNDNSFNPIGTRFGLDLFPYKRSGIYFDYKSKNPFSIYKGSTPYLYLNRTSGIEIRGDFDPLQSRGIAVPINRNLADNYRISAIQMWIRSDEDLFSLSPVELCEINYKGDLIKLYIQALGVTGRRARIYAKSTNTGQDFSGLSYYWNGNIVREPVMTIKEWGVLGIRFASALNFDSYLGGINLNGPVLFNNVAFYQANNLQQVQSTLTRPWLDVKTDGVLEFEWSYWKNNFIWDGVLVISASDLYGVNPSDVYKAYIGTNKIIVDDDEGMTFDADNLKIYSNSTWSVRVGTPV